MKKNRHQKLKELVEQYEIETQDELAEKLKEAGFDVTQATVSRDIRELKLTKVPTGNGRQKYTILVHSDHYLSDKYIRVLKDGYVSMDVAQNILVVKTVSGMAMAVAAAIDAIKLKEIVGCIAGDDTIMLVLHSEADAIKTMENIKEAWRVKIKPIMRFERRSIGGKAMLENLHVKNLALIDEQEITFTRGLNILTGETGAGKSIVLGSIHLALGAKADKDSIRSGADYALIELVFSLNDIQKKQMEEMEIPLEEDGTLLLQRKIMPGKSICRINGETVSVSQLKELSGCLMDMYGQHEHQTLLKPLSYGRMLDQYIGSKALECKEALKEELRQYQELKQQLDEQDMDEEMRKRQADLLSFEVNEIEAASCKRVRMKNWKSSIRSSFMQCAYRRL